MAFHLRSISLPSRPHATETEINEEMLSLEASISSSPTIGVMCDGLRRLGDIYDGIEENICLPSSQVCAYQQRTVLDGEMDGSLELLDLCGAMQDIFAEMKAIIQELQLSLRKGDDVAAQASIQEGQESFQEDHEEDFGRLQDGHALGQGQRDLCLSAGVHTPSLVEAN